MFRTEVQIEEDLQEETRILTMPDGKKRPVRLFVGQWKKLPCALYLVNDKMDYLIQQALDHLKDHPKRGFDRCFADIIHYWNLEYGKICAGT